MRLSSTVALMCLAPLVACKSAQPPAGFGVDLTIDARSLSARTQVTSLDVTVSGAETYSSPIDVGAITGEGGEGVVRARYVPGATAGELGFRIDALDASSNLLGTGAGGPITLVPGSAVSLDITLADAVAMPDMTVVDLSQGRCTNGNKDGDETDVDCGGSCPRCDVGKACMVAADCMTGACYMNRCELASGPPGWVTLPSLPAARTQAAAAPLDDTLLYVIGGTNGSTEYTSIVSYSLDTNDWTASSVVATPARASFAAVPVGSQIIAVGGLTQVPDSTAAITAFTAGATQSWADLSVMLTAKRADVGVALASDNRVYVAGGRSYPDTTPLATFESFDPAGGTAMITGATMLPSARFYSGVTADAAGHVVVAGGNSGSALIANVDIYDPMTTTWYSAPALDTARDRLGAALGADGRVYAVGGGVTNAVGTVEALPLAGPRWVPVQALTTARAWLAVTQGWDGRIYAIGGTDATTNASTTVEAYGPSILTTSPAAAGTKLAISGSNFAANAKVTLTFSGDAKGTVAASGVTSASGVIAPSLPWTIPVSTAAGTYTLTAEDDRSRYPVRLRLVVTP